MLQVGPAVGRRHFNQTGSLPTFELDVTVDKVEHDLIVDAAGKLIADEADDDDDAKPTTKPAK